MAVHMTCGNKPLSLPTTGCDDCSELEERVEALEQCCDDVHTELDGKADKDDTEDALERIEAQLNSLVGGWHYINDIPSSDDLPTTFEAGEVYYSEADSGFYVALVDRPNDGGTLADWGFISSGKSSNSIAITITTSDWQGTTCTVTAMGVDTTSDIIVSPDPSSMSEYLSAGVYCSAQGTGTLTFTASTTPTQDITVNVLIV